jgi:predicted DNA binding CopG/RHH family protein
MKKTFILDPEEKELLKSFENNEFVSVPNLKAQIRKYSNYAKATLNKLKHINIRITERDLFELKKKALDEGITCQTLISDIIHKYVTGKLKSIFDKSLK